MITLDQLKDNYIMPVLNSTPFHFMVFTDAGDYRAPERRKNTVTEYINGLFTLTQSEIQKLGAGLTAVAIVTSLRFLVPCDHDPDHKGELQMVQQIRDALSEAFSQNVKLSIVSDGKTRNLQQGIGDSLEYVCTVTFAYLENAVNASDIKIFIDGTEIPYTNFLLTRRLNSSADLYKRASNGEAQVYAESSTFTIDLETPALYNSPASSEIINHILGVTSSNKLHTVVLQFGDFVGRTSSMIFGECTASGAGVSNVVYKVSLLPYAAAETVGG